MAESCASAATAKVKLANALASTALTSFAGANKAIG
jgi:hypothetical protein